MILTKVKKMMMLVSISMLSTVFAQDDIQLGIPGYGGNGCPSGSASVTLSPDNKSLSIIFDEFITEAGPGVGKTLDRKSCNIAIPVHIPQGYSVSIIGVDYRGFVSLPSRRSFAQIKAEYFLAGSRGPIYSKRFRGAQDTDYLFSNEITAEAVVWSACGADVNLRVNASMLLRNSDRYDDALATVDSADVSAGIIYQLQWRRCY